MGGWDRQTWQQGAFRLCGPWGDVHLPCNGLNVIIILQSLLYHLCKRGCLWEDLRSPRDAKHILLCVFLMRAGQKCVNRALSGFICCIQSCMDFFFLDVLWYYFHNKNAFVQINASNFWCPREVSCRGISRASLDRHDCSKEVQFLYSCEFLNLYFFTVEQIIPVYTLVHTQN